MSKYRIDLKHSRLRQLSIVLAASAAFILVFSWRDYIFSHQYVWQILLSYLIVSFALYEGMNPPSIPAITLNQSGSLTIHEKRSMSEWRISPKSVACAHLVMLYLVPHGGNNTPRWLFVFSDQVNRADFGRISRSVFESHHNAKGDILA